TALNGNPSTSSPPAAPIVCGCWNSTHILLCLLALHPQTARIADGFGWDWCGQQGRRGVPGSPGAAAAVAHESSPSSSPSSSRYTARSSSNVPSSGDAHSPRSAASSSRSAMPRSAHGLDLRRNALVSESNTYEAASCSYIQSSTTPAVAS